MKELPTIAAHAKLHNIIQQKKLGQNFIFDASLCSKIVRSLGVTLEGQHVVEIGPGPGGLTRAILEANPAKLTVIEKDSRCISLLEDIQKFYPNLEIIAEDALKIHLPDITNSKVTIISNLPYNIGTVLLFQWLEHLELLESMTLMLQKEVVDRICAAHSTKAYGKLSVMCQIVADVKKQFDVSPKSFYPPPKVHSSIVSITPKSHAPSKDIVEKVRELTHSAFTARRKMIRTSLSEISDEILHEVGLENTARAENVSVEQYLSIARMRLKCDTISSN